jgi:hypothetical protein
MSFTWLAFVCVKSKVNINLGKKTFCAIRKKPFVNTTNGVALCPNHSFLFKVKTWYKQQLSIEYTGFKSKFNESYCDFMC